MSTQKKAKVLTVVVTFNAEEWIYACLNSVVLSSVTTDILVVDNASEDSTCAILQEHYPTVSVIRNNTNLGFGQANNIGLHFALEKDYSYVLLLNQDARISQDMLKRLLEVSENSPEYAIISPLHLTGKQDKLDFNFYYYLVSGCPQYITDIILQNNTVSPVYSCDFINAAIWLMTKQCITKVGGFNPLFFHTGEDVDYCVRVLNNGLSIGVCPDAYAYHHREDRKTSPFNNYFTNRKNHLLKYITNSYPNFEFRKVLFEVLLGSLTHLVQGEFKYLFSDWKIVCELIKFHKKIKWSWHESLKEKAYL
jgi:GT2 family glycosyltransferase